jgi:hypothetical protein
MTHSFICFRCKRFQICWTSVFIQAFVIISAGAGCVCDLGAFVTVRINIFRVSYV